MYQSKSSIFDLFLIILLIIIAILIVCTIAKGKTGGFSLLSNIDGGAEPIKFKRLKMDDEWLDLLQDGKKKVDVRLSRPAFEKVDKDSYILYFSGKREVAAKVNKKILYEEGITDLLKKEKIADIFPGEKMSPDDARLMFLSKQQGGKGFYKEEDLDKPFVALHVSPLHN